MSAAILSAPTFAGSTNEGKANSPFAPAKIITKGLSKMEHESICDLAAWE